MSFLLKDLQGRTGCQYLSDLRYLSDEGRARAAQRIHEIPPEAAALAEWNDALAYLAGGQPVQTAQLARERLLLHLMGEGRPAK